MNIYLFNYLVVFFLGILVSSILYGFSSSLTYIFLLAPLVIIVERYFFNIKKYLYSFSIIYFFIIIFLYYFNFKINANGFFPHFDDSFYYNQGKSFLAEGYYFDSVFDVVVWFFQLIGSNNFSLSAINWFLSILVLGLVYKVSIKIKPDFKPFFLIVLAFNMFFLECVVMLLRDFLGLFFLLTSIFFILNKSKLFLPFAIFSMLVRHTTGIVAFIFYFFYNSKLINGVYKGKFIILLFLFTFIYLFYNYVPVGFLSRSGFDGPSTNFSLADWNKVRFEFFFGESVGDLTTKLISLGAIAAPLLLILNIFTPLKPSDIFIDVEYKYMLDGVIYSNFHYNIFNYASLLSYFHLLFIGFFIIPFFDGFRVLLKKYGFNFILLTFLICLIMVSYVSYQPRHRLHFLIFMPLICSYTNISLNKIFIYGLIIESSLFLLFVFLGFLNF